MSDSDDEPSWFQADEQLAYETGSRIQTLLGDTGSVRRETRENDKNKSSFVEPLINPVSPDIVESGGTEREQFQTIVFKLDAITQMVEYQPARWIPPPEKAPTFPEECRAALPLSLTENPILLHTNMDAGHGGASGRFKILKEVAMEYAFLIGIEKKLL